jgi:hypothetical protein
MHRREKGRGGHGFSFGDLQGLWASGADYAIVTHAGDRTWQFWWRHPERGWHLQSWHRLLTEAKEEAEKPRVLEIASKPLPFGTYACAEWKSPYGAGSGPIMVRCSSDSTLKDMLQVFDALGCTASVKTIG